ncbi:hypothetical protein K493DRAFT_77729 [Basidiobolus meristosporus CBS 931.73]|uniref:Uncharacterized protein n=1 Tax=Basidiobolus meristosporus CBS 931.73 TaxID=1314790 RepID=A0A1Y1XT77_9FUNG|nr:hypothetical protein K493DRAFT_77729 [Basidiobolus meristosporus CBS 931.73]|eukprot:ORX88504.1 hypothetical protein K493DRAFT_77729 [Basidiobolus meristosporus CBS 931.73]
MGFTFGSFTTICRNTPLPICNLFQVPMDCTQPVAGSLECPLTGVQIGGVNIGNIGDIVVCVVAFLCTIYMGYLSHQKYAAVGRKEMKIFLSFYLLCTIMEILSLGRLLPKGNALYWVTSIHIGFIVSALWVLLLNGLVGFQFIEDGTPTSTYSILFSGIAVLVAVTYICLDTVFGITGALSAGNPQDPVSVPLFVLYILFPVIVVVLYVLLQVILVFRVLAERRALLYLIIALVAFVGAHVVFFLLNKTIYDGTRHYIDSTMFGSLLILISVGLVFKYWSSITEDEWDDFDGLF